MRRFMVPFSLAVAVLVLWPVTGVPAAGSVTGSLITNGQKTPLVLAYVDESPEDIIIVLASKTVPADVVPFIGEDRAEIEDPCRSLHGLSRHTHHSAVLRRRVLPGARDGICRHGGGRCHPAGEAP